MGLRAAEFRPKEDEVASLHLLQLGQQAPVSWVPGLVTSLGLSVFVCTLRCLDWVFPKVLPSLK